jgi:MFS transporter, DHA1 family, multidrug resistance protein
MAPVIFDLRQICSADEFKNWSAGLSAGHLSDMLRPDTFALTAVLGLLTAVGPLSVDMYLPSLPEIGRKLAASPAQVQLTISFYLVGFAVGQIVYGPLSDRHGRKPILVAALGVFSAASLACAFVWSIELLLIARLFQALGGAGAVVLARAIVRDLYSEARAGREFSLMGAVMGLAPIIAPLVGSLLQIAFGWRAIFVALFAIGSAAAAVVWFLLPETLKTRAPERLSLPSAMRLYGAFLKHGAFLAHLGIVTCSFMGLFAWISGASFVLQDLYGLLAFEFGMAFALGSAGYMLGTVLAAGIVVRIGIDRTIGLGALALAIGGLAMVAAVMLGLTGSSSLVLPAAFYLLGLGLAMPQGFAGAMSPFSARAGAASSLVGFVQQTCAAVLGAVVGHMLGGSAWPLVAAIATMGCLTLAIWMFSRDIRAPRKGVEVRQEQIGFNDLRNNGSGSL